MIWYPITSYCAKWHIQYSVWTGSCGRSQGKQSQQRASWLPADKCVALGLYVERQPAAISISVKDTATGESAHWCSAIFCWLDQSWTQGGGSYSQWSAEWVQDSSLFSRFSLLWCCCYSPLWCTVMYLATEPLYRLHTEAYVWKRVV